MIFQCVTGATAHLKNTNVIALQHHSQNIGRRGLASHRTKTGIASIFGTMQDSIGI